MTSDSQVIAHKLGTFHEIEDQIAYSAGISITIKFDKCFTICIVTCFDDCLIMHLKVFLKIKISKIYVAKLGNCTVNYKCIPQIF